MTSPLVQCRSKSEESAAGVFAGEIKTEEAKREKEIRTLHAKIGQLTVERDFLAEAWGSRRELLLDAQQVQLGAAAGAVAERGVGDAPAKAALLQIIKPCRALYVGERPGCPECTTIR